MVLNYLRSGTMTDYLTSLVRQAAEHLSETRRFGTLLPFLPVMVAIALSITACSQPETSDPSPPRPVKFFTVRQTEEGGIEQLTGYVHAHDETSLGFRLDGRILTRQVDVGDHVRTGDVLATLDSTTTSNAVRSAQADMESARAAENLASLNLRRMRLLMPSGAIARAQLESAESDQVAAVAKLKSNEASLSSARENLSWTRLTAPSDGVIISVSASAGQVVTAGQTVATLASGSGRDVVLDVPNPAYFIEKSKSTFKVCLLDTPGVTADAQVRDVSPQADPQTRTWRVRLILDNPPSEMMLGATVSVTLPDAAPPAMSLPASSLTRIAGRPAVFLINPKDNRLERRSVVIARFSASDVYIATGLSPGDKVVTAGVSTLRDGEVVSVGEEQG